MVPSRIATTRVGLSLGDRHAIDASNARKALNQILDKAELIDAGLTKCDKRLRRYCCKPAPITYVSCQLGHKDSAISLHGLPAEARDLRASERRLVTKIFSSWNRLTGWLRQIEHLRNAA